MGFVFGTRDKQDSCLGCFDGDILGKVVFEDIYYCI